MSSAFAGPKKSVAILVALLAAVLAGRLLLRSQPPLATSGGVAVTIPAGWQWNTAVTNSGGPISLNNFRNGYLSGGILPPGGADIEVTRGQPLNEPLGEVIKEETAGTSGVATRELPAAGTDAVRVAYQEDFGPNLRYSVVTYYLVKNGKLYKFYLNHHAGDAGAPAFVQTFDQLVAGAKIGQ